MNTKSVYKIKITYTSGNFDCFECEVKHSTIEDFWAFLSEQFLESDWVMIKDIKTSAFVTIQSSTVCAFSIAEINEVA